MARKSAQATEARPSRSRMYLHEDFVDWYNDQYDTDLNKQSAAKIVAAFSGHRNEYRATKRYRDLVEGRQAARAAAPKKTAAKKTAKKAAKKAPAKKAAKKAAPRKAAKRGGGSAGEDVFG